MKKENSLTILIIVNIILNIFIGNILLNKIIDIEKSIKNVKINEDDAAKEKSIHNTLTRKDKNVIIYSIVRKRGKLWIKLI